MGTRCQGAKLGSIVAIQYPMPKEAHLSRKGNCGPFFAQLHSAGNAPGRKESSLHPEIGMGDTGLLGWDLGDHVRSIWVLPEASPAWLLPL